MTLTRFMAIARSPLIAREADKINPKRVRRLMRLAGIRTIYPGVKTSNPHLGHEVHRYLLRDRAISEVNQAWQVDITYIKLPQGTSYLIGLIDVYSRRIMGWQLSNSLGKHFCLEALGEALNRAKPEIINSDQGSQFQMD